MSRVVSWCGLAGARVLGRVRAASRDIILSAFAAAIAWLIARYGLGHQLPVFAPICAIVSLAPGLPSHGKQAVGLMAGMAVGISVGEASWLLNPDAATPWLWLVQMVVSVILAMLLASGFGLTAVVPIQAGVSVILVLVTGPQSAGLLRLIDGAVGVATGLAFSQFLATPDPVRRLRAAMQAFLDQLARGLETAAAAVETLDPARAAQAERTVAAAWTDLRSLQDVADQSRASMRWSLRGRLVAGPLLKVMARQNRHSVHLYAHVLMFAEALCSAVRQGNPPPGGVAARIRLCACHCRIILGEGGPAEARSPEDLSHPLPFDAGGWGEVVTLLDQVEQHLGQLVDLRRRAGLMVGGDENGTGAEAEDPGPDDRPPSV